MQQYFGSMWDRIIIGLGLFTMVIPTPILCAIIAHQAAPIGVKIACYAVGLILCLLGLFFAFPLRGLQYALTGDDRP